MKVLISAYACAPDQGSEPLIGFVAVEAAAREHEVWVLTQPRMVEVTVKRIAELGLGDRVTIIGVAPDATTNQSGLKSLALTHLRHERWQRAVARTARDLHAEVGFDLAHHVTLAAYWMPSGVAQLSVPLVWGPVGGGVVTPVSLLPELGRRGLVEEVIRRVVRRTFLLRPAVRGLPARATVAIAQNAETAAGMRGGSTAIFNNGIASLISEALSPGTRSKNIIVVSRLDAWKGMTLALRALRLMPGRQLSIFGQGGDRVRLEQLIQAWGLGDRVTFEGFRPRSEVLEMIATAGVLLHPSLHEEGGGAVSEALALGTPIVALDRGGPGILRTQWPASPAYLVTPAPARVLAKRLAAAMEQALATTPPVLTAGLPPVDDFGRSVLDWYRAALSP